MVRHGKMKDGPPYLRGGPINIWGGGVVADVFPQEEGILYLFLNNKYF